jgi:hypothetical protein
MTVYVVVWAYSEIDVTAHGVYRTKEQAQRVVRRLKDNSYFTVVRWSRLRLRPDAAKGEHNA